MGIINLHSEEYGYNCNKKEYERKCVLNGLSATPTFLNNIRFKKANKSFECNICKKENSKNTRYIGEEYVKVCIDCSSEWFNNSIKELEKMKDIIIKNKSEMKLNKEKWEKERIIGGLQ